MKSRRGRGALLGLAIGATVGFVAGISDGDDPEGMLYAFLQSTYEAAANTSKWNRNELEK